MGMFVENKILQQTSHPY